MHLLRTLREIIILFRTVSNRLRFLGYTYCLPDLQLMSLQQGPLEDLIDADEEGEPAPAR